MDHDHQPPPPDLPREILSMTNKGGISLRNEWVGRVLMIDAGVQPCLLKESNKRRRARILIDI